MFGCDVKVGMILSLFPPEITKKIINNEDLEYILNIKKKIEMNKKKRDKNSLKVQIKSH